MSIRENTDALAQNITLEQGKTLPDARGDVFRGQEVVEMASSLGHLLMGETQGNVSKGIDTYSYREPLGVTGGICPFNFPAMIPLWMFPVACAAGNTSVIKPSEKDPSATMMLAQMATDAGLPPGVLNVIHGAHDCVNFICDDPTIKSISFVGGNQAGEYIHARGTALGKRVQANLGAKNHATIMPDADRASVVKALAGAAFGAAGQRCMALSTCIFVGETKDWIPDIVEEGKKYKVGSGFDEDVQVGPLISPEAKQVREGERKTREEARGATGVRSEATKTATGARSEATKPYKYCSFSACHFASQHCEFHGASLRLPLTPHSSRLAEVRGHHLPSRVPGRHHPARRARRHRPRLRGGQLRWTHRAHRSRHF